MVPVTMHVLLPLRVVLRALRLVEGCEDGDIGADLTAPLGLFSIYRTCRAHGWLLLECYCSRPGRYVVAECTHRIFGNLPLPISIVARLLLLHISRK